MVDALDIYMLGRDERWVARYINFLKFCGVVNSVGFPIDVPIERHHILPRSLYPELKKDIRNIVKLTAKQHFVAHYMLAKIYGGSMYYAFNMMRRVGKRSALYGAFRKELAELVSKANKGRTMSVENRKKVSERSKNKVPVVDLMGNSFSIDKSDPRYINGEVVSCLVGNRHSSETIEKMKISSHVRGKTCYNNGVSNIWLLPEDSPPNGFSIGSFLKGVATAKGALWFYNPLTKDNIRLPEGEIPPKGYVQGRYAEIGFSYINDTIRVFDFSTKTQFTYESIDDIDLPEFTFMRQNEATSGKKLNGSKIFYEFATYVASNENVLRYFLTKQGYFLRSGFSNCITIDEIDTNTHKILTKLKGHHER